MALPYFLLRTFGIALRVGVSEFYIFYALSCDDVPKLSPSPTPSKAAGSSLLSAT